jgi:hypothetical protein
MAQAAIVAVNELARILTADTGLKYAVEVLATNVPAICEADVLQGYASTELLEKSTSIKYPQLQIYCDRVNNKLTEKFRTFSGTAELTIEIRVTHEHIDALHTQLNTYVQAVTDVLDRNRGTWTPGVFYTGAYEITFQAAKRGGKNFIQSARVRVETHVSMD